MADRKLDIFSLLKAMDKRDGDWFSRQPADVQKEFAPVVAVRWAATIKDSPQSDIMLSMVNERVNAHLFDLQKHPDLVFRLMASCGLGASLGHQWLAGHKRNAETNKAFEFMAQYYPDANDRELDYLMSCHTKATFMEFLNGCGVQQGEAKELLKSYDKLAKD